MGNRSVYVSYNGLHYVDPSGYGFFRWVARIVGAIVGAFLGAEGGPVGIVLGAITGYQIGDSLGAAIEGRGNNSPSSSAPPATLAPQIFPSPLPTPQGLGGFSSLNASPDLSPVSSATQEIGVDVTEALVDDLGLSPSVAEHIVPALESAAPPSIWADVILFGVGVLGTVTGPDPTEGVTLPALGKGASGLARRGAIVIGENMKERVIPYAKKIGADWYRARGKNPLNWMRNNREALRTWMAKGKKIIDTGPDLIRRKIRGPSPNYEMETRILRKRRYPVTWDPQP